MEVYTISKYSQKPRPEDGLRCQQGVEPPLRLKVLGVLCFYEVVSATFQHNPLVGLPMYED